ncbi:hypothetical protein [Amycolatopsis thailandensis]|uniref:hypothetical protein n=1 Tax=Amycolatopsis thailandensis TaxID=589330 RepID=UPI001FCA3471|nr:hypothetical protein [Amycolatopsis thailandensis]
MTHETTEITLMPRGRPGAQRLWAYLALGTVSLINLISFMPKFPKPHEAAWGDALNYYRMSEQTGAAVDNPFALRMLSPWIIHRGNLLTGLSLDVLWVAFTFVVTLATVIVFFEFLRSYLKLQLFTSVLAAVALACTFWYAPYAFSNPWLVDPLNNLLYLLAIWFILNRKLIPFAIVIVLGAINKETTLLLAPLYPLIAWTRGRSFRDRDVLGGIGVFVVAAGIYVGYRIWAQNLIGGDYGFGAGQSNSGLLDNIRFALNAGKGTGQVELFTTFHFFWLIFGYGLYQQYRRHGLRAELLIASIWLFACCLAGRLVATDTARVFVMMAPLLIALVAVVLDQQRGEGRRLWVGALFFLYIAVNLRFVGGAAVFWVDAVALLIFAALVSFPATTRQAGFKGFNGFRPHQGRLDVEDDVKSS